MGAVPQPDSLASMFDELDRRLRALESGARATNTSVQDGSFQVLDAAGNSLVRLGKLPNGGTGIQISNANGRQLLDVDSVFGWGEPFQLLPMVPGPAGVMQSQPPFASTSSAALTELYRVDFWASGGLVVVANLVQTYVGSGVTGMAWQITAFETASFVNGNVPGVETVVASGTTSVAGTVSITNGGGTGLALPAAGISPGRTGTDPRGGAWTLRFKAQVTAGSGFCSLAPISCPLLYG